MKFKSGPNLLVIYDHIPIDNIIDNLKHLNALSIPEGETVYGESIVKEDDIYYHVVNTAEELEAINEKLTRPYNWYKSTIIVIVKKSEFNKTNFLERKKQDVRFPNIFVSKNMNKLHLAFREFVRKKEDIVNPATRFDIKLSSREYSYTELFIVHEYAVYSYDHLDENLEVTYIRALSSEDAKDIFRIKLMQDMRDEYVDFVSVKRITRDIFISRNDLKHHSLINK